MNLVEVPNTSCFAHTLQLVVNDGLKSQRAVIDVVAKTRNIGTHFNPSVLVKQRLRSIQVTLSVPQHSILQSVPTRWISVFIMLERALEQKSALAFYAAEHGGFQEYVLTNQQWLLVENLIATLKLFQEITFSKVYLS